MYLRNYCILLNLILILLIYVIFVFDELAIILFCIWIQFVGNFLYNYKMRIRWISFEFFILFNILFNIFSLPLSHLLNLFSRLNFYISEILDILFINNFKFICYCNFVCFSKNSSTYDSWMIIKGGNGAYLLLRNGTRPLTLSFSFYSFIYNKSTATKYPIHFCFGYFQETIALRYLYTCFLNEKSSKTSIKRRKGIFTVEPSWINHTFKASIWKSQLWEFILI